MEQYGKYKYVRNAAWQALIDFDVCELPVNLSLIAHKARIRLIANSKCGLLKESQIGLSLCYKSQWYIVFDDTISIQRIRFTVAHELGHIFLGHLQKQNSTFRTVGELNRPQEEREADMFAIRLLAPACVLNGLNAYKAEEIASLCNISIQSATFRAERMIILKQRNRFLTSSLEKQVYSNFQQYIKNNRLK